MHGLGNPTSRTGEIRFVQKDMIPSPDDGKRAYNCTLNDGGDAICIVRTNSEEAQYWYKFSMTNTNDFLLRMFCKNESEATLHLVSEKFDCTLEQWQLKLKSRLWNMQTNSIDQGFADILLDIMQGILYFNRKLEKNHGRVCSKNVYIVEGKAKLVDTFEDSDCTPGIYSKDYDNFADLVEEMSAHNFANLVHIPTMTIELNHFINLVKRVNTPYQFEYLMNHPVLLTPKRRCNLRMEVVYMAKNQSLMYEIEAWLRQQLSMGYQWGARVDTTKFRSIDSYNENDKGPITFFRFNRNACEHMNDMGFRMNEDELDFELNAIWPEFMHVLFEACLDISITLSSLWKVSR